ncbi:hypothetical protein PC128_g7981 [Phytophthora cactorum]|nr:hypothetical protein PC128_g7981 [Phytophthora cactorum]
MRDVSDGEYWDLEIQKVHRGEDGLAAIVDTGITPRERLDEIEKTFFPAKGRVTPAPVISVEMLEADYAGYVLSFDGAAKPSTRQGSCGCVIWKLPGWRIPTAQGFLLEDATVNRVMQAVTRSHARDESDQYVPRGPVEYQAERWRRIKAHQDSDPRLSELKKFLKGEFDEFSRGRIKKVSKPVEPYVLDARDVLYRLSCSTEGLPRNMSDKLRIAEVHDDFHFKPHTVHPKRPTTQVEVSEDDDFDAVWLAEDSWEADNPNDEYDVEKILDLRWTKRTRTSKKTQEYLIKWKCYEKPEWLLMSQLNCGALLYEFNQGARARTRFRVMQAGDDHPRL